MSSVKKQVKIAVENLQEVKAELVRFYAPITVDEIIRKLPLEGFLASWENAIYITVDVERGAEKPVTKLRKGDIFYWPPGRVVGVALEEHSARTQTVKVGRCIDDVEPLKGARNGSRMRISPL
ncbi:MAG TPA: hypothetical protein EYH45_00700 [Candidatus Caldiarchaeum subterraneum]|uniref:Cyclophilin TM1367-like domain-containing protein n=1 Tax=Caldiarchaeum subterraneum TaxID=311458 RepID=A0A832ZU63_CALS0|nr:hypothetical protein [Aigarchaeota archaeon]HIQ29063.1 hypothetical protein [Candidatus Caldarchaeum subterraneum]